MTPASLTSTSASAARTADDDNADELVLLLIRTVKAIVERLRAERADQASPPMTVVHGLAARYLVGRDDVTAVELARYLGITKQSTSEVVTALEHAGIVRRAPHPTDRRARVLLLSDAGAKKLADGRERWKELEDDWAALVGRDQLDVVRSALAAYLDAEGDRHVTGDCSSSC